MGNCLTSNCKIVAQEEINHEPSSELDESNQTIQLAPYPTKRTCGNEKKMVRFKLEDERNVDRERHGKSKDEVVRIRVVVTKKELKHILSYKKDFKCSSVEELVTAIKLSGRLISHVNETREEDVNDAWRPALESIPEDH
ncbi:DUF4228 domain-containing protein [Cephalotus follicularis]|uniref:DUF4228 domain-containing protein n=1 Tax=Cephalotus follicularis TaxID=3775 RepID=A0A1Q3DF49_CEPFO|nr:DUF4228 domain-containing protein [Cephalotus follicularis]